MYIGRSLLIYIALKYKGVYSDMLDAVIKRRESPSLEELAHVEDEIKGYKALTYFDKEYPEYLKKIVGAPLVLFYKGDISLISDENLPRNLAVIGTREPTEYGINATKDIVYGVVDRFNIVSGLAIGIDGTAHEAAVEAKGKTIAVLGSGINNVYPPSNRLLYQRIIDSGGLVISEYPDDTMPDAFHFPLRNRIIVYFSNALVVTEAYEKSGTSITTTIASEVNKTVMAIPYPYEVKNSFCNQLINEGCFLVCSPEDVKYYMAIDNQKNI